MRMVHHACAIVWSAFRMFFADTALEWPAVRSTCVKPTSTHV